MALWLVRAGKFGELEKAFLDDQRIYLTWGGIDADLSVYGEKAVLRQFLEDQLPDFSKDQISNALGQIWAFRGKMQPKDWVVLPSQLHPSIHIGEITGDYTYKPSGNNPSQWRSVEWLETDVPRSNFDQDLLYSFGAAMTICRISRNDAEQRVRAMAKNNWQSPMLPPTGDDEDVQEGEVDLERLGRDQIAKILTQKFKGHAMARLVEELLVAQGYTTYRSPEGTDKGVDILAAPGPLGFGTPRICVQVKSGDTPVDRPTLDQLIGTMQNVQADQGLFVSWGGFKSTVDKERAAQFFRVRLWNQDDLISELLESYDDLDETLQAEIPLKRIWTVAYPDAE